MFPCSGILYLCFKSLGLDITSVLLNPFKMAATYPFLWFLFLSKNPTNSWFPRDTLWIENVWSIPTGFAFELETYSNWILSISISKIYLRSCSNLLIGINPRSLPPRNELILSTRAPSWTIYNPTKNEGFEWNRTNDVEPRAPSFLYKYKIADVKIHNGSVLQVARCFLPHRFKRSFTITFL